MLLLLPIFLIAQVLSEQATYRELKELAELLNIVLHNYDSAGLSNQKRYSKEEIGDFIRVCHQEPIELGLVIDSSSSIPEGDFEKGQSFLKDFLSDYDIGPGRLQVRVCAVSFGLGVYTEDGFNLNTYKTKQQVLDHITSMEFKAGTRTDTGDAIKYMRQNQMVNTRSWAPKIAIVITDGNSQNGQYTKQQAEAAIADNITMFAVGVGLGIRDTELLNIAGGNPERVVRATNYDDLKNIKKTLAHKTCEMIPRPTTTPLPTTTPPAAQPCHVRYPADINFIFSPASLGLDATGWVTQFISHTITDDELISGFQYGVVSGDCPDDEGFGLNQYSDVNSIRDRLDKYDRNNLPAIVGRAYREAFTVLKGAREQASKVAVIFLGKAKVDSRTLNQAIEELQTSGVRVFVARTDPGVTAHGLHKGVTLLGDGSSSRQAAEEFVSHLCYLDETNMRLLKSKG